MKESFFGAAPGRTVEAHGSIGLSIGWRFLFPLPNRRKMNQSIRCEHEERRERKCFASEPVAIRDGIPYIKISSPRSFIPIPGREESQWNLFHSAYLSTETGMRTRDNKKTNSFKKGRREERLIFSREAKLERIEQMVQLHNFIFFITSMVVPRGTAAPFLLKWFVSRDVPTGAPFSNGLIIPILIPSFPLLVYLHSRKFIRSMDGAKSGVLVRASRPILLPDIIGRSSSETRAGNASFRFVPVLHFLLLESKGDLSYLESFCGVLCLLFFRTLFSLPRDRSAKRERARRRKGQTLRPNPNGNEQQRNDKMRCSGHPHLERRVEGFGPVAFPVPPSSGGACVGGVPPEPEIGLEALALPTSRLLMAVGHDYHQKAPMKINISHFGVCICILGVLLSCDPAAYVRPVAHASYTCCSGRAA
ncbi:hypothetical protein Lal_00038457 [Lupinus albus]|nr:hypothetical protein Lal_00038457 [Lupinus albus]